MTFIESNEWKLPFNFALGLHVAMILSVIYLPQFLNQKPIFPDIYTVDLIQIEAPQTPVHETVQPIKPAVKKEKKAVAKNAAPILEKTPPPVEQVVAKPISIKPLKRKKIKEVAQEINEQQLRELEKLRKERLAEARQAERLARETARLAASEAVNQLKEMIRESNSSLDSVEDIPPPRTMQSRSSGKNRNVVENQYFASIHNKLQPYWKPPENKLWDTDLMATIVIQISKNGNITNQFFEKPSGDRLFDQFVLKALQDAAPLPPIPSAMQKNSLELGLHFKPGSIQY